MSDTEERIPTPEKLARAAGQEHNKRNALLLECAISLVLLFCVCFLPAFHLFAANAPALALKEQMPTVLLYFGIAVVLFAVLRLCCRRRPYFAGLLSAFVMFFLVNFSWLQFPFEQFVSNYVLVIVLALVLYALLIAGFVFLLLPLTKKASTGRGIAMIFCIMFCALLAVNAVTLGVNRSEAKREAALRAAQAANATAAPVATEPVPVTLAPAAEPTATPEPEETARPQLFHEGDTPNIYYFILDEYATFTIMEQYYGYDNAEFRAYLEGLGFHISDSSYVLTADTSPNIVNALNLDYVSLRTHSAQWSKMRRESLLYAELQDLGYELLQSSTNASVLGYLPNMRNADHYAAYKSTTREGVVSDQIVRNNGLLGALDELLGSYQTADDLDADSESLRTYGYYSKDEIMTSDAYFDNNYYMAQVRWVLEAFDFFENDDNYMETEKPLAVFSYMKCPHAPFVFDEYGRVMLLSQATNWRDPSLYINQYKFVTKHLSHIIAKIISFDPSCIIVLQSDHGVRKHGQLFAEEISSKDERQVLNAIYFCGMELDIEGQSPVNTLRLMLSTLGKDYPPVEDYVTADSLDDLSDVPEAFKFSPR